VAVLSRRLRGGVPLPRHCGFSDPACKTDRSRAAHTRLSLYEARIRNGLSGMARDEGLEELLRDYLNDAAPGVTEKAMFGGRAWLLNGNLLCGARDDGMLARLGKDKDRWALEIPDVVPMISRGRQMPGWVRARPDAFGDDGLRQRLLDSALA